MKKTLSLLALILAVSATISAKSYPLYVGGIQVTDDNRANIMPGVTMDDPQLGNSLHLRLNNATISTTADNTDGIYFTKNDDYNSLVIFVNGVNHITTTGRDASAICVTGDYARLDIYPENDSYLDTLYMDTHLHAIMLNGAHNFIMFGDLSGLNLTIWANCGEEPLYSYENDAQIILYNTTLALTTGETYPIIRNFASFTWENSPMPLKSLFPYTFEDGQLKSGTPLTEVTQAMLLMAPLPIGINADWIYTALGRNVDDFRPSGINTDGKISYNVEERILTFENVQMEGMFQTHVPGLKLHLKGTNTFSKNIDFDNDIFNFLGRDAQITGEANATLEIDGGGVVDGIRVNQSLEIGGFAKLTIKNANMNAFWGLKWNPDESGVNNLVINVPVDLASSRSVFYGFNNVTWSNSLTATPADATYNTSSKKLVNGSGQDVTSFQLEKRTGIESVSSINGQATKRLLDGQVLIQSQDGRIFNVLGTQIK